MCLLPRKIVVLPLLLSLLVVLVAPPATASAVLPAADKGCCAHPGQHAEPDFADTAIGCQFCSVLSFDLTAPLTLRVCQAESLSLALAPPTLILAQFPTAIDWPPERT
ncbi:hypothetical protein [Geoalkalibacter halelectricus]|uniref:DUF2946 domain-containing protein n=1 Tax=Geoalkalibacter halelectricus TaxID=2847045 RepID=A0ABY5ZI40_9BACT|nr:hypothetical protein [Geoalkalibacter halelectricus]MDO3379620.1 hypothetical protein [Geoalkalibacter halelectricus]UWZ78564.1 hypothetical protein L9S41_12855 [Geoalkalibacter halelectricus]